MDKPYVDNSAMHKAVAIYIIPYLMALLVLLIIGQIGGQFFTIAQLNKTSGVIADVRTSIVSHTTNRVVAPSRPNYALLLTLNNGSSYAIQDTVARNKLAPILHTGDSVIIYYPSLFYRIVNAGLVKPVEQIELKNKILYSFEDEKKGIYNNWLFISVANH